MHDLESIIKIDGLYATAAEGTSMLPFIRPKIDTVVIAKAPTSCAPMDVVLYRAQSGRLVLHRVLKERGDEYLISGDNCTFTERVPKSSVIGRLVCLYRGEEKTELTGTKYHAYVNLWCRPYHLRMLALRIKNRICRYLHGRKGKA